MRAVKQGQLDSLCGMYAVVNALEGAGVTGPRCALHKELFQRLTVSLPTARLKTAISSGMDSEDILDAARPSLRWLKRRYGIDLKIKRLEIAPTDLSLEVFVSALRRTIDYDHMSAIVNVHLPGYSHWTVASRINNGRLVVRDSGTLKVLDLSRFSLDRGRYRFSADETLVLIRSGWPMKSAVATKPYRARG